MAAFRVNASQRDTLTDRFEVGEKASGLRNPPWFCHLGMTAAATVSDPTDERKARGMFGPQRWKRPDEMHR